MSPKDELKKFWRFLALAIAAEIILMGFVAATVRAGGNEWSWHTFGIGLDVGGAAAYILGMYSLIGGGRSFKTLTRALKNSTEEKTKNAESQSPDYTFLLLMVLVGSVAIGAGQWLQKTF